MQADVGLRCEVNLTHLVSDEPLQLPPDRLHRAYLHLLHSALVDLRSSGRLGKDQAAYVSDLADALHNVPALIAGYDDFFNDERYRKTSLRPFDAAWSGHPSGALRLEAELDEFLRSYDDANPPAQALDDAL